MKTPPERLVKKVLPLLETMKVLANPVRLALVAELARGSECSVGYLVSKVGVEFSIVSKNLAILTKAGMVEKTRSGQWIYYRLATPGLAEFLDELLELSVRFG